MPLDPYGFPDTGPKEGGGGSAIVSLWCGIAALVCGVLGPCLCYTPWFVALPLAAVAVWYGAEAKRGGSLDPGLDTAATGGLVAGGIALFFSLLYIGIGLLYAGFIAMIAVADM